MTTSITVGPLAVLSVRLFSLPVDERYYFRYRYLAVPSFTVKLDMFTGLGLFGLPRRCGKIKDLTKFDASFFGVHPKLANVMDPQLRILLEVTYEALVDAGGPFANL